MNQTSESQTQERYFKVPLNQTPPNFSEFRRKLNETPFTNPKAKLEENSERLLKAPHKNQRQAEFFEDYLQSLYLEANLQPNPKLVSDKDEQDGQQLLPSGQLFKTDDKHQPMRLIPEKIGKPLIF